MTIRPRMGPLLYDDNDSQKSHEGSAGDRAVLDGHRRSPPRIPWPRQPAVPTRLIFRALVDRASGRQPALPDSRSAQPPREPADLVGKVLAGCRPVSIRVLPHSAITHFSIWLSHCATCGARSSQFRRWQPTEQTLHAQSDGEQAAVTVDGAIEFQPHWQTGIGQTGR